MLNRLFGKKKDTGPPATLDDASASIGGRISETEAKIQAYVHYHYPITDLHETSFKFHSLRLACVSTLVLIST